MLLKRREVEDVKQPGVNRELDSPSTSLQKLIVRFSGTWKSAAENMAIIKKSNVFLFISFQLCIR